MGLRLDRISTTMNTTMNTTIYQILETRFRLLVVEGEVTTFQHCVWIFYRKQAAVSVSCKRQ